MTDYKETDSTFSIAVPDAFFLPALHCPIGEREGGLLCCTANGVTIPIRREKRLELFIRLAPKVRAISDFWGKDLHSCYR